MSFSKTYSIEKLPGFCRGGNSRNVARCLATIPCAGTITNRCSINHLSVLSGLLLPALEWIGTQVEQLRRPQPDERLHPNFETVR